MFPLLNDTCVIVRRHLCGFESVGLCTAGRTKSVTFETAGLVGQTICTCAFVNIDAALWPGLLNIILHNVCTATSYYPPPREVRNMAWEKHLEPSCSGCLFLFGQVILLFINFQITD